MLLNKYTLSVFSIIFGAFLKIYDDLNDNKLFKYNKFLKKYKKYINEFLKLSIAGLFTIISFNDFIFCFIFTILNVLYSFLDTNAYSNSFEFSGLICSCLLCIYLYFTNNIINIFNLIICLFSLLFILLLAYYFDYILFSNIEFGINKLIIRFIMTISCLIILYLNINYINLCNNFILSGFGYFCISCIFQIFLIYNDKKLKKLKKVKKVKKLSI